MQLSDLVAYAGENYHISEQFKWTDFPGYSVLVDPETKKWVALLMRRWDSDLGSEIELCDIKCGREVLDRNPAAYLSGPYRMHGKKWVGVRFDERTEDEVVFRMLDRAMEEGRQRGFKVVLGRELMPGSVQYEDTVIPGRLERPTLPVRAESPGRSDSPVNPDSPVQTDRGEIHRGMYRPDLSKSGRNHEDWGQNRTWYKTPEAGLPYGRTTYQDTDLSGHIRDNIPEKIRQMWKLYDYGDSSFELTCRNFYVQGKFMEDYEDDAAWEGRLVRYFPSYHMLRTDQLRGYFSWRTSIRRGIIKETNSSFVYIYLYELLNQIGTGSVVESLERMRDFEKKYLDAGFGNGEMQINLHRWMLELAVVNGLPVDQIIRYASPAMIKRDEWILTLREPESYSDQEVFDALCALSKSRTASSIVIKKHGEEGIRLFARVWRRARRAYQEAGTDLFSLCFGTMQESIWHPLANSLYYKKDKPRDVSLTLTACRRYTSHEGVWHVEAYQYLYFDHKRLAGLMHETDRRLRIYLKAGRPLKEMADEAWAADLVQAVIEEDQAEKIEAARPKIYIDFSELDRIRQDARVTRDSLLVEEEEESPEGLFMQKENSLAGQPAEEEKIRSGQPAEEKETRPGQPVEEKDIRSGQPAEEKDIRSGQPNVEERKDRLKQTETGVDNLSVEAGVSGFRPDAREEKESVYADTLDMTAMPGSHDILTEFQVRLLKRLLAGQPVREMIVSGHGMPEIVADDLNEALFDEIGDAVVECDGGEITLIEDYREDIEEILG